MEGQKKTLISRSHSVLAKPRNRRFSCRTPTTAGCCNLQAPDAPTPRPDRDSEDRDSTLIQTSMTTARRLPLRSGLVTRVVDLVIWGP